MLGCCVLMFYGTLKQHQINATTLSGVMQIPMSWVYGVGYITSVAMGLMILGKLIRLARGGYSDGELIQVQDSEDGGEQHIVGAKR
jgi:TRAP-type C4-dicarboxylate transport system permease small subunit